MRTAQAAANELEAYGAYAEVRAPFGGVVTQRFVDRGAFVAPGAPIVAVEDGSRLRISVTVAPAAARRLKAGARVEGTIERVPVDAVVEGVAPAPSGALYTVNALGEQRGRRASDRWIGDPADSGGRPDGAAGARGGAGARRRSHWRAGADGVGYRAPMGPSGDAGGRRWSKCCRGSGAVTGSSSPRRRRGAADDGHRRTHRKPVPPLEAHAARDRRLAGGRTRGRPGHAPRGGAADLGPDDRRHRGPARRHAGGSRESHRPSDRTPDVRDLRRGPCLFHGGRRRRAGHGPVPRRRKPGAEHREGPRQAVLGDGPGSPRRHAAAGQAALDRRRTDPDAHPALEGIRIGRAAPDRDPSRGRRPHHSRCRRDLRDRRPTAADAGHARSGADDGQRCHGR